MSNNLDELKKITDEIKKSGGFAPTLDEAPPSSLPGVDDYARSASELSVQIDPNKFSESVQNLKRLDPNYREPYWDRFQEMTADFNPIQKAIAYSTYPIQWLLDTTAGKNLKAGTGNVMQSLGSLIDWVTQNELLSKLLGKDTVESTAEWLKEYGQKTYEENVVPYDKEFSVASLVDPKFYATTVAQSLPYSFAFMPLGLAGASAGGSVATALGLTGKSVPIAQMIGAGVASGGAESLMEAGNVYREMLEKGASQDEASEAAGKTFLANAAFNMLLNAGEYKTAFQGLASDAFESVGKETLREIGKRVVLTAGQEAIQEGGQDIISRWAQKDPIALDNELAQSMAIGAIMGGGMAGVGSAGSALEAAGVRSATPGVIQEVAQEAQQVPVEQEQQPATPQQTQTPIAGELPLLTETRLQQLDNPTTSFNVRTGQVEETPLMDRALNLVTAVREFQQAGDTPNYPILLGNVLGAGREYEAYAREYAKEHGGTLANHPETQTLGQTLNELGIGIQGFGEILDAYKKLAEEIEPTEQRFVSVPGFGRQKPSGLMPVDPIAVKPGDVVYDPRGKQFTVDSIDSARGLLRVTDERGVQTSLGVNVAKTLAETATGEAGAEIETEPVEIPTVEESVVESPLIESQTETSDNIPEEIPGSEVAQKPLGDIDPAFKKVGFEGGTLQKVVMYNPETKEALRITVDDMEYPRGESPFLKHPPEVLERLIRAPIDEEAQKLWKRNFGNVFVGDVVEVVKGRKYPHGTRGVVSRVYDYKIPNSSQKVPYVELEDGKRVALSNVRYVDENAEQTLTPETPIAQQEESIPIEELVAKTREAIEQNKDTIEMAWLGERLLPGVRLGEAYDVAKMYVMLQDGIVNQTEYDNFIADLKRSGKVSGLDAPQTDVAAPSDVQTPIVDQTLTEPAKGRETPVIDSQAETSVVAELPQVSETDTTTETTTIDSLADDLKGISPRAKVTMQHLMDQDIGRVIRDIETGAESKEAALTLYERAAEALQLSPEARAVHRDRIRGAKEPAEVKERPIIEPTGNVSVAYTPVKQIEVQTRFEVVPIEDVLSSEQEGFPSLLQPRKAVSADERRGLINQIKRNLNPARLEHNPNASDGSPIVNKRLEVEAGNGRVLALREMAREGHENYDLYKQWLLDNSRRLGIDPEKISQIENPILVRVRTNEIENVREYVEDANVSSVTRHSAAEQASIDAGNMTQGLMNLFVPNESGVIDTAANREFIQTFMNEVVPESERNSYYTGGKLNVEGYRRVQGAILAKAFGENYRLLTSMLESTDDNVKKVSNGLLAVAPHLSRIKDGIAQGHYHDLDITYELAEAANKLSSLKAEGQSVDAYLRQMQLPGMDDLGSLSRLILQKLDEFGGGRRGSQKKVATFLNNYAELVEEAGSPNQMQIPGLETEVPSKAVLIEAASSPKAMGVAEQQNTLLFDEGGVTGEERVQEPAPSRPERSQEVGEQVDSPSAEETTSETGTDRRVKLYGLIEKYALKDAAKNAVSQNKHNVIGQFLAAIEQLDDLSSEQANKFAEKLASEATILFSTPRESRFYGREQNELVSWLDNFVRVARIMEEQNIPATTEEVIVASGNDKLIKMNLQLFSEKKDGKKSESEWQELFASFFTDTTGESSGVGEVIDAGTSERVPSVEDGKEEGKAPEPQGEVGAAQEAVVEFDELPPIDEPPPPVSEYLGMEPEPISELEESVRSPKELKDRIDKELSEIENGENESEYLNPFTFREDDYATTVLSNKRVWEGKNIPTPDPRPDWVVKREAKSEQIWEGLPKQRVKLPISNKELRFVETPGLKHDQKTLEKPLNTQYLTGLSPWNVVGNTVTMLGTRSTLVTHSVNKSMQNEIRKRMAKWTPEQRKEAALILDGRKPISGELSELTDFVRSVFDEYRTAFGIGGYIKNYMPHKAGDAIQDLIESQDEALQEQMDGVPGALDYFAKHERTSEDGQLMFEDVGEALSYWFYRGIKAAATEDFLLAVQIAKEIAHPSRHKWIDEYAKIVLGMPGTEETFWNNLVASALGKKDGYKGRHVQKVISVLTELWYDGAMMGNLRSAIKNLTQQALTIGFLSDGANPLKGPYYWARGVQMAMTKTGRELLKYSEILNDRQFLESLGERERVLTKFFKPYQGVANLGWKPYKWADTANVTTAYLGGIYKALERGKNIEEAIRYGDLVAAQTQYTYGTGGLMLFKGPLGRLVGLVNSWPLNWLRMNLAMVEGVGSLPPKEKRAIGKVLENLETELQRLDKEFSEKESSYAAKAGVSNKDFSFFEPSAQENVKFVDINGHKYSLAGVLRVGQTMVAMALMAALFEKMFKVEFDDTTPKGVLESALPVKMVKSEDVSPAHSMLRGLLESAEAENWSEFYDNTSGWLMETINAFIPATNARRRVSMVVADILNNYWAEDKKHRKMYQKTPGESFRQLIGTPIEQEERKNLTKTIQNVYIKHFDVNPGETVSVGSFKASLQKEQQRLLELGYTVEGIGEMTLNARNGVRTSSYNRLWKALQENNTTEAYRATMVLVGTGATPDGITSSFKNRELPSNLLDQSLSLYERAKRSVTK